MAIVQIKLVKCATDNRGNINHMSKSLAGIADKSIEKTRYTLEITINKEGS